MNDKIISSNTKEKKKSGSFLNKLYWAFICIMTLFSVAMFSLTYINDKYPYEYNYYYNKIINGIDIENITFKKKNEYYVDYNYDYVQNTNKLFATSYQDLINISRTFMNSGLDEVSFYCSKEYTTCLDDISDLLINDKKAITFFNTYNHPFNDFKKVYVTKYDSIRKVTLKLDRKYSNEMIKKIEEKFNQLYDELVDPNDTDYNNILRVHDYIVNNTEYDTEKANFIEKKSDKDSIYSSDTAYGVFFEGKAICSGYSAAMYLFLDKMGVRSMRVSTMTHVWNGVYLDGKWYHLDLTWDKGKYTSGETFLRHKYFLIDTDTLLLNDTKSHDFDKIFYKEFI